MSTFAQCNFTTQAADLQFINGGLADPAQCHHYGEAVRRASITERVRKNLRPYFDGWLTLIAIAECVDVVAG
jgi:hypothetical protein